MIDYINKPKAGFSFFLNQVVLLFSILFFGSSCFEGIIKDKGKKPYEYNKAIVFESLKSNNNRSLDHLDKARAKLEANYVQKHYENQKENIQKAGKECITTGFQEAKRQGIDMSSLGEEDEDLQKAIEESKRTAELEEQKRDALYINSVLERLNELQRNGINIQHIEYILEIYRISSNKEDKIHIKRMIDDYIDVVKQDEGILPSLAMLQVVTRASRPSVMSKKELIKN